MTYINAESIQTLHAVKDQEKLNNIAEDMKVNGWNGRAIVVIDCANEGYQALTGTHRINAAIEAGISEIPCEVISAELFDKICNECDWSLDMIVRDPEMFCSDLSDYDNDLAELLSQN